MKNVETPAPSPLGAYIRFHSNGWRRTTMQTLSFVLPALRLGDAILDVGCGHGYVPETLVAAGSSDLTAVDVLDARRVPLPISSCSMACTCRSTTDASTS